MKLWPLLVASVVCLACQRDARPSLVVETARAQLVPSGVGAVYVDIVNVGGADRLLAASSASSRAVELHEVVHEGDVARMVHHPQGFEVPAGGRLELRPGGKHLMLLGLKEAMDAREITLTLQFERSGSLTVTAPVQPL